MGEKSKSRVRIFIDGEEIDVEMNQIIFGDFWKLDIENDDGDDDNDVTIHDWQDFWGDTY